MSLIFSKEVQVPILTPVDNNLFSGYINLSWSVSTKSVPGTSKSRRSIHCATSFASLSLDVFETLLEVKRVHMPIFIKIYLLPKGYIGNNVSFQSNFTPWHFGPSLQMLFGAILSDANFIFFLDKLDLCDEFLAKMFPAFLEVEKSQRSPTNKYL